MSVFGDGTPEERVLQDLKSAQSDYGLSLIELIAVIARVLDWLCS